MEMGRARRNTFFYSYNPRGFPIILPVPSSENKTPHQWSKCGKENAISPEISTMFPLERKENMNVSIHFFFNTSLQQFQAVAKEHSFKFTEHFISTCVCCRLQRRVGGGAGEGGCSWGILHCSKSGREQIWTRRPQQCLFAKGCDLISCPWSFSGPLCCRIGTSSSGREQAVWAFQKQPHRSCLWWHQS